ncbi:hypothetical protein MTO96_051564 [Rhipicephalus appendiculatus]
MLQKANMQECMTSVGPTAVGSPLQYLRPQVPHGYEVLLPPEIPCVSVTSPVPSRPELFKGSQPWHHDSQSFDASQATILKGLEVTCDEAIELEKNTRRQSESDTWKKARLHRVTASSFGVAVKRLTWTEKGLHNFTTHRDLSRLRAIQYGIANEQGAVQRYISTLRTRGHNVEVFRSGLIVEPSCPWLGASPDRLVFDPAETPPHGILEVKCPYSLKGKSAVEIGDMDCMKRDSQGIYRLDRNHDYYYQVLGQMALSHVHWAHFIVFSEKVIIIDRIKFFSR